MGEGGEWVVQREAGRKVMKKFKVVVKVVRRELGMGVGREEGGEGVDVGEGKVGVPAVGVGKGDMGECFCERRGC